MPARRWSTSSRPIRATSCSRPARTSCSRSRTDILHLQERQTLRLFLRRDAFARFVSCLVYVPRERYNTAMRERMQRHPAARRWAAREIEFQAQVSESILARILFIVRTPDGMPRGRRPGRARGAPDRGVAQLDRPCSREALIDADGEEEGNRLFARLRRGLPGRLSGAGAGARRGPRHRPHRPPGQRARASSR